MHPFARLAVNVPVNVPLAGEPSSVPEMFPLNPLGPVVYPPVTRKLTADGRIAGRRLPPGTWKNSDRSSGTGGSGGV